MRIDSFYIDRRLEFNEGKIGVSTFNSNLELTLWKQDGVHTVWVHYKLTPKMAIKLGELLIHPPKKMWHVLKSKVNRIGITFQNGKIILGISDAQECRKEIGNLDWFWTSAEIKMTKSEAWKLVAFLFFWAGSKMIDIRTIKKIQKEKILYINEEEI